MMGSRSPAAARGPRAPRAAQADAAAVPRRSHARVRGDRTRGGRARGLDLAQRCAVRAAPADAGDHARGDPARGVRRHRLGRPRPAGRAARAGCWRRRRPRGCSSVCCCRGGSAGRTRSRVLQTLRQEIDALLAAEIAARRAEPGEDIPVAPGSPARFEDGEPMDDAEYAIQPMTLLLAGHETTATGLAWTFDLLLRHPHVLHRSSPKATTTPTCARSSPSRCGCARWCRWPAGG